MESIIFSLSATSLFTVFAVSPCLLFFCVSSLIRFWKRSNNHEKRMAIPEASGSWPLLGHLPLLGGSVPPHLVLSELADRCGPTFTVRLGVHRAIVVNTWEMAKECLTTHDRSFATRPKSVASEVMSYNYAIIGISPYGPYWRHARKISTVELLSSHRLELLKHVREAAVHASIKDAHERWRNRIGPATTVMVDMKRLFGDIMVNAIFQMMVGKRFGEGEADEKGRQALRDWFELTGRFVVSDALPFLRWFDIGGHEKAMRKTRKELDDVVQGWLDEHKADRLQSGEDEKVRQQDFMGVLLSRLENNDEVHTYDADTVIKAVCMVRPYIY